MIHVQANDRQFFLAICTASSLLGGFFVGLVSLVCAPFFGTQALTQGLVFCTVSLAIALTVMLSSDMKITVEHTDSEPEEDTQATPSKEAPVDIAAAPEHDDIAAFVEHLKEAKAVEEAIDAANLSTIRTATPTLETTVTETLTAEPSSSLLATSSTTD